MEAKPQHPLADACLARIEKVSAYSAHSSLFGGSRTRAGRKAEIYQSAENGDDDPLRCPRNGHCNFVMVVS